MQHLQLVVMSLLLGSVVKLTSKYEFTRFLKKVLNEKMLRRAKLTKRQIGDGGMLPEYGNAGI